ncbi:uncharacterized protein YeaO (DUF488 family) [Mycoplana sp. BE70]|uniref:DUF488 domain-containing protein n=1 Tax=Mycoplana sp. BE70 TaxID=2817775 RepID=UPI002861F4C6|nr:DUF488 family protein [Mycoplana sp. BE70]MDR6757603.1 uncharacterized protein YeaO (DUF488 family) [Mycoplana sp. BE70]
MSKIAVKRIYAPSDPGDGMRILVDRLWPRGISKAKANIDLWLKDISPSDDLRKRFHAKPESWDAFRSAYAEELTGEAAQAAAAELRALLRNGPVTLLFAARDERQNNAVALKEWLQQHV